MLNPADQFLTSAAVRAKFGVTDMTLHRWLKGRGFPRPLYIAKRRYWRQADVDQWVARQAANDNSPAINKEVA